MIWEGNFFVCRFNNNNNNNNAKICIAQTLKNLRCALEQDLVFVRVFVKESTTTATATTITQVVTQSSLMNR